MYEKKMLMTSTSNSSIKESKEVTVPIKIEFEDVEKGEEEHIFAMPNTTIVSGELSSEDSGRHTDSDDNRPRGILKKLSLDESENIDNGDREDSKLWGVRLRPVGRVEPMPTRTIPEPMLNTSTNGAQVWRSTVTLRDSNPPEETPTPTVNPMMSSPGQMELQKLIRSLRPSQPQRQSLDLSSTPEIIHNTVMAQETVQSSSTWSVAERIRQHEDRKSRGFSTKVNLGGSGETTVLPHSESVWLGADNNINASPTRRESSELRTG
jgi:hypothetical protein